MFTVPEITSHNYTWLTYR